MHIQTSGAWQKMLEEIIFPTNCVSCHASGVLLCQACLHELNWIDQLYICPHCGAPYGYLSCTECSDTQHTSDNYARWNVFNHCISALIYDEMAQKIIHGYKDELESRLSVVCAACIAVGLDMFSCMPHISDELTFDAICFVPDTRAAVCKRGFDHMKLIAQALSRMLSCEVFDVLVHADTKDQRSLSRADRSINMHDSFYVFGDIAGARILLIDDVITTGATICEAGRALSAKGVANIVAASVCRVI